jgi:hypothetical protein
MGTGKIVGHWLNWNCKMLLMERARRDQTRLETHDTTKRPKAQKNKKHQTREKSQQIDLFPSFFSSSFFCFFSVLSGR